jgi:hypothetical protein
MTPDVRAALRTAAEAGVSVFLPPDVVLALLESSVAQPTPVALPPADLGVGQIAGRFGRKPSTVRAWLEQGRFPGAYKLSGRDWRAPAASIAAFEEAERTRGAGKAKVSPLRRGKTPDLGSWRRVG